MVLCTLLLHNQNSESHFHAHTHSHCRAHTQKNMHTVQTKCCQRQTFMNQSQSGTDTKTLSSDRLQIWVHCHRQTHIHTDSAWECLHTPMSSEVWMIQCVHEEKCDILMTTETPQEPHWHHTKACLYVCVMTETRSRHSIRVHTQTQQTFLLNPRSDKYYKTVVSAASLLHQSLHHIQPSFRTLRFGILTITIKLTIDIGSFIMWINSDYFPKTQKPKYSNYYSLLITFTDHYQLDIYWQGHLNHQSLLLL